jgi:hypothetical protein
MKRLAAAIALLAACSAPEPAQTAGYKGIDRLEILAKGME